MTAAKGFGSRLIEQILSAELEGEVKMEFDRSGLRARLDLPLNNLQARGRGRLSRPSSEDTFRPGDPATLHGTRVLVVEDEHLVGQDTAEALRSAGCSTLGPIATVQEALRVAVSEDIDAAVLDINLNGDLVWPVARALKAREIPLVFTTGYADTVPAPRGLENVTRIEKPVEPDRLLARLSVEVTRKAHAAPTH